MLKLGLVKALFARFFARQYLRMSIFLFITWHRNREVSVIYGFTD